MKLGPNIGSRPLRIGPRMGATDSVLATISRDASSNIYVPNSASQWTAFLSAVGLSAISAPTSLYLCQESSGSLADSIGSVTLGATGTPLYQQSVTGWTRKGVSANADGAAQRFGANAGTGPNPATTSISWLILSLFPANPASVRSTCGFNITSATDSVRVQHQVSGIPRLQCDGVNSDGAVSISNTFVPLFLKFDRTNSVVKAFYKDEAVAGTYSGTINDGSKGFCNGTLQKVVYACRWDGATAEISDANIKALVQALGFTVGY